MFAQNNKSDYNGRMVRTLREKRSKLSELVERASSGQDVHISVRRKVQARLTGAEKKRSSDDRATWVMELRALRMKVLPRKSTSKVEEILEDMRDERK